MRSFAIINATIVIMLMLFLGYVCAMGDGFAWLEWHVRGFAGALIFPAVAGTCMALGGLLAITAPTSEEESS